MTENGAEWVHTYLNYSKEFQALLTEVVARALQSNEFIAAAETHSLYSAKEISSGAWAAHAAGLSVTQGVGEFVMLDYYAANKVRSNKSFFHKLRSMLPPRKGSVADKQLSLATYVLANLLNNDWPSERSRHFTTRYSEAIKKAVAREA